MTVQPEIVVVISDTKKSTVKTIGNNNTREHISYSINSQEKCLQLYTQLAAYCMMAVLFDDKAIILFYFLNKHLLQEIGNNAGQFLCL